MKMIFKWLAPKEKPIVKTKKGLISNEKKQSKIIAKYFENIFYTNATPMYYQHRCQHYSHY